MNKSDDDNNNNNDTSSFIYLDQMRLLVALELSKTDSYSKKKLKSEMSKGLERRIILHFL